MLMGKEGVKQVVVNSVGREIRELEKTDPTVGRPLQLTIDADVQKSIEDSYAASGFNGAAVVLDPRNGDVLGFTSRPSYDPNAFAAGIDRATWASLNGDSLKPLQNRALQGKYSPGSTFKMAVGLAGLEEGIITPSFQVHCGGGQSFYGRYFKCWKKGGHGTVNLKSAIEQSCDVYFYTVGNMLGVDKINKWATLFGLGVKSNIDLPNGDRRAGAVHRVEGDAEGKEVVRGRDHLGLDRQGQVAVTPVSMAVYAATMANGGTRVTPHLVKAIDDGTGLKPRAAAAAAVEGGRHAREARSDPPGHVGRRQRRRHRRPGAGRRARRLRQDRHRAGHSRTPAACAAQARYKNSTSATTAGSSSSRRATTRESPAWSSSSTASTAERGAGRAPHPGDLLRQEGRQAAAAAADPRADAARLQGSYARAGGGAPTGGGQ
jgi:hypothetical protein